MIADAGNDVGEIACGSRPFMLAVSMMFMALASVSAPVSAPANSQLRLPIPIGLRARSKALLPMATRPSSSNRQNEGQRVSAYRKALARSPLAGMRASCCSAQACNASTLGLLCAGTVRISVCGWAVAHYATMALMKRSPNMMANCALIPACIDHDPWAHFRRPMVMMRHG